MIFPPSVDRTDRSVAALLFIFCFLLPIWGASGQTNNGIILGGRVVDSSTGEPIDNAIIYVQNSTIGTSSDRDGNFTLPIFLPGTYEIITARVGYSSRTLSRDLSRGDSVWVEIQLSQKVLYSPGVEIVGESGDNQGESPGIVQYLPIHDREVIGVYGGPWSVPIAFLHTDSGLYMLSFDIQVIDSEKFLRVWVLFLNLSESPYRFDPVGQMSLSMTGRERTYRGIAPYPRELFNNSSAFDTTLKSISNSVGSSLETMASLRSSFLYEERLLDKLVALEAFLLTNRTRTRDMPTKFKPAKDGTLSSQLYTRYSTSVNVGLLSPLIVNPGISLQGCVYFPFPGSEWKSTNSSIPEAAGYQYELHLRTQTGVSKVTFVPFQK